MGESPKTVLKIFMRHPDDTYYKRWMTTDQSSNYKMLSTFLEGLGVTLYFKDLPMYEENTIVAQNIHSDFQKGRPTDNI